MLTSRRARQRITLQRNDGVNSARGAMVDSWTTVAEVSAMVEDVSSGEKFEGAEDRIDLQVDFYIRYRDDVTEAWRILFDGDVFEIVGRPVDPDYRKWELKIRGRVLRS